MAYVPQKTEKKEAHVLAFVLKYVAYFASCVLLIYQQGDFKKAIGH
jgi:hypothetical protein